MAWNTIQNIKMTGQQNGVDSVDEQTAAAAGTRGQVTLAASWSHVCVIIIVVRDPPLLSADPPLG